MRKRAASQVTTVNLQYNGQEQIPADPATVWAFVNDPDKVGHCLPDLLDVTVHDATHFDAVVRVGVGPVRGKFKFKFELQPDEAGPAHEHEDLGRRLRQRGRPDRRRRHRAGRRRGTTLLNWNGAAVMRGPVAAVGGRVLDAQAQKLIAQTFAQRARERSSLID